MELRLLQALREGVYDIGFLMEPDSVHASLQTEVLTAESLVPVCAPTHALAGAAKLATVALAQVQLVGTEPGCPYRDLFEDELRERNGAPAAYGGTSGAGVGDARRGW
jgi:DNA-binding transcriptional LysR family regulator